MGTAFRLIGIACGLLVLLAGIVVMIGGVVVTVLLFPLGIIVGLPTTLLGGWVGGAGLAVAGLSAGGTTKTED